MFRLHHAQRKAVAALLTTALISGCVSFPPDVAPVSNAQDVFNRLAARGNEYAETASDTTKGGVAYNAVVVAATLLAGGAVAFAHGAAATNLIAGAGLGAAGATLLFQPSARAAQAKALTVGRRQLACLQSTMAQYSINGAQSELFTKLEAKSDKLQQALKNAETLSGDAEKLKATTPENIKALVTSTTKAAGALVAAQTEESAYSKLDSIATSTYVMIDTTTAEALAPSYLTYSASTGGAKPSVATSAQGNRTLNLEFTNSLLGFEPISIELSPTQVQAPAPAPAPAPADTIVAAITEINSDTEAIQTDTVVAGKLFSTAVTKMPECTSVK